MKVYVDPRFLRIIYTDYMNILGNQMCGFLINFFAMSICRITIIGTMH